MRTRSEKIISIILCLVCTAAFTACQKSGMFVNNDENGKSYTLSEDISLASAVLRDINPITSNDSGFYQITKLVYESLVSLDDTLTPKACLAESWDIDPIALTAEFKLRSDARFSDGSRLTANDVVFSFNACKASSTSPYLHCLDGLTSAYASGDSRVIFKLASTIDVSPSDFVFPIVSSGQYLSQASFLAETQKPVLGSGPYMIVSADLKNELVLEANQHYRGEKPSNRITFKLSPVQTPYYGFVDSGELTMMIDPAIDSEDVTGNSNITNTELTSNEFEALGFNCRSGPCSDSRLRRAIAFIVDRDAIKRSAYYNRGIKSDDLYFPGYYGSEIKNYYGPDPDLAYECLTQAGYIDVDGDGLLENESGDKLSLSLVINSDNQSRRTAADFVVEDLLESGIRVTVSEVPGESFVSAAGSGEYDMFIGGWKVSEEYDLRSFYHSAWGNPAGYSSYELDPYLDKMRSGISGEEMESVLARVKSILENDMPYLCLMYRTYKVIFSSHLEGLVAPRFNNYYFACEDWKVRVYEKTEENNENEVLDVGTDSSGSQISSYDEDEDPGQG